MDAYKCSCISCEHSTSTLRDLVTHMRHRHAHENSLGAVCNIDSCMYMFNTVETYRKHVAVVHSVRWNDVRQRGFVCEQVPDFNSFPAFETVEINEELGHSSVDCDVTSNFLDAKDMYSELIKWVSKEAFTLKLKMEFTYGLSARTTSVVFENICDLVKTFKRKFSETVDISLQSVDKEFLSFILSDNISLEEALKFSKGGEERALGELGYIAPQEICIPMEAYRCSILTCSFTAGMVRECATHMEQHHNEAVRVPCIIDLCEYQAESVQILQIHLSTAHADKWNPGTKTKEVIHYVPIVETLRNYLSHGDVLNSMGRDRVTPGVFDKYTSGTLISGHPLFCEDGSSLMIYLYSDEFGLGQELGPHCNKNKVTGVYFIVGNIESKYCSALQSIHLAILAKYSLVKKYGYKEVLKPLVADLKVLETEGIIINVNGCNCTFKGAVAAFLGDNLASHSIGGFRSVFSSGKVCRHCLIDYKNLSESSSLSNCVLRTKNSHDVHVSNVKADPSLGNVYGVIGPSHLSGLSFYHPVDCHPQDMSHDIQESFMPIDVSIVIRGLLRSGIVGLSELEHFRQFLRSFSFGPNDKSNKLTTIHDHVTNAKRIMPGTASEKSHFFRMFSLVFGPHVPEGNVYWRLHLLANDICDLVLAPAVYEDWLLDLERFIQEYILLFNTLPSKITGRFKPKLHFLVHYPDMIRKFGSLRNSSCIRFESFHVAFKKYARTCNNYINITKTLSNKFQKKRCLEYAGSHALPPSCTVIGIQQTVSVESLTTLERKVVEDYLDVNNAVLLSARCAQIDSQRFQRGDFMLLEIVNDIPVFFEVIKIYAHNGVWFLYGKLTYTVSWDNHLHAYEVISTSSESDYVCIAPSRVVPMQNLDCYRISGSSYIKLKHRPLSVLQHN